MSAPARGFNPTRKDHQMMTAAGPRDYGGFAQARPNIDNEFADVINTTPRPRIERRGVTLGCRVKRERRTSVRARPVPSRLRQPGDLERLV
jgi:hypothetical protein